MTVFSSGSSLIERVHPLQFCYVLRKIMTLLRHWLPVVDPLVFYPWRAWDFLSVAGKWAALALRYRTILRRVLADKDGAAYMDEALKPATEVDHEHDFVAAYADKIPDTYGAPKREPAAAAG